MKPKARFGRGRHMYGTAFPQIIHYTAAEQERVLDGMVAAKLSWLRIDISWEQLEPRQGEFKWAKFDRVIKAAAAHDIEVLVILGYTPKWANGNKSWDHPPVDNTQFAEYCAAVAEHYTPMGVMHYEIWNEPNTGYFWRPQANAVAYTRLLKRAYNAIKRVNRRTTVLCCGLAPASTNEENIHPTDFLRTIYEHNGKEYFDAVNYHPYTYPDLISAQNWSWRILYSLRQVMRDFDDEKKKIWLTEYGAPTNGAANQQFVSEERQAVMLSEAVQEVRNFPWAGPLFFYNYQDLEPIADREAYFGLHRHDGTPKPAYDAVKQATAKKPKYDTGT